MLLSFGQGFKLRKISDKKLHFVLHYVTQTNLLKCYNMQKCTIFIWAIHAGGRDGKSCRIKNADEGNFEPIGMKKGA